MAAFTYTARDESGRPSTGTLDAADVMQAREQIRASGKYPITIVAAQSAGETGSSVLHAAKIGIKVSRAEVIQLSTQLSVMLETGVTLTEAIDCIAMQIDKPQMKMLLADLSLQIQGGGDFSSALARHPKSFPQVYIALIRASEKSGMLSKMLIRATTYLRDEQEIIRKVRGALTYPSIMLSFAVTTTIFLLAFVLPKFTVIYANKGAALPVPTKILMGMSNFVVGHYILLPSMLVVLAVASWFYFGTPSGRSTFHYIQLNVPLLGAMFRKLHLSRGLRMMGTMGSAGVSLLDSVDIARELCPNAYFQKLWSDISEQIRVGKPLSDPLSESGLVPRSVSQMIRSGEKSGKLAFVMEQVATFSEQELKEKIADLTRYIEPAMICIMGFIIGGVALALMLPIFTISRVVAH